MSTQLISKLNSANDSDIIEVVVWIKDIDDEKVESEIKEKTGLKEDDIKDELGPEKIKNYISQKRSISAKKYKASNTAFMSKIEKNGSIKAVFQSTLSPMMILSGNKADIYSVAKNIDVVSMDLFEDSQLVPSSIDANKNSFATYMRDTIGATGTYTANGSTHKIKIGQIEPAIPDFINYNSYFDTADCYRYGTQSTDPDDILHATLVAAIMVGKSFTYNGKTYRGIAPNAELYSYRTPSVVSFYNAVENLVKSTADGGCGVNIINMSAGFLNFGYYDTISQWVDHIAYKHDVHFVIAAGNTNISPDGYVASPGMAYNAITVGNFENLDASGNSLITNSYAPSTLNDQILDYDYFRINPTSCYKTTNGQCKPDISANGTNVTYDALTSTGTSFAAPQVSGIIAQLCSKYPSLLTKQNTVKAILTASAAYWVHGEELYTTGGLLDKQGAGAVNSRAAYSILTAGKYLDITLPNTTQYYTKTITVPSSYTYLRVSLAWIKKNIASSEYCNSSSAGTSNNYQNLANLKLEVFEGTGTSGIRIGYSNASNNNLELVEFPVNGGGTYTIRITNSSYNDSSITGSQYISLAWY